MKGKDKFILTPKILFISLIIFPFVLTFIVVFVSSGLYSFNYYKNANLPISSHIKLDSAKKVIKKGQEVRVTYEDGSEKTYRVAKDFRLTGSRLDTSKAEVQIDNDIDIANPDNRFIAYLPVFNIGLPIIFWCVMLYHALSHYKKDRIRWILFILLIPPLGSMFYFFLIYRHAKGTKNR